MKTLMQELDNILAEKNSKIALLEWENQTLKEENEKLKYKLEHKRVPFNEIANAV